MRCTIRKVLTLLALPLMLMASGSTPAETSITGNPDGSVSVTIDSQEILIPAELATAIVDAVKRDSGNPESLRASIRALVAGNAGGADDVTLATAIAVYAVLKSNGRPKTVTAIVEGAVAGNAMLSNVTVLAALPPAAAGAPAPPVPSPRPSQETAENPHVISPVS